MADENSEDIIAELETYDDDAVLKAILEVLRADNGARLRSLLSSLGDDEMSQRLRRVLLTHPNLRDLVPH